MNIVGVERENKGNHLSKHKFILNLLHSRIKTMWKLVITHKEC